MGEAYGIGHDDVASVIVGILEGEVDGLIGLEGKDRPESSFSFPVVSKLEEGRVTVSLSCDPALEMLKHSSVKAQAPSARDKAGQTRHELADEPEQQVIPYVCEPLPRLTRYRVYIVPVLVGVFAGNKSTGTVYQHSLSLRVRGGRIPSDCNVPAIQSVVRRSLVAEGLGIALARPLGRHLGYESQNSTTNGRNGRSQWSAKGTLLHSVWAIETVPYKLVVKDKPYFSCLL